MIRTFPHHKTSANRQVMAFSPKLLVALRVFTLILATVTDWGTPPRYIAHLQQECHNSKFVIFQETLLKVLMCYNFL
jgi:hypothetical protein